MSSKFRQIQVSAQTVKNGKFLDVDSDESEIRRFTNMRKTQWKAFGNRRTDFLVVTNKKLIYVYFVKAHIFEGDYFYVGYIPYEAITKIQAVNGSKELSIYFVKDGDEVSYNLELRSKTLSAISLIQPMLS